MRRTFSDKTDTIFDAKIGLDKLLFAFYSFLRFNTSIHQLNAEIDVSYPSLRRHVEQFNKTLDAPAINFVGPVEINEIYRLCREERNASATLGRARVLSRNVDVARTRRTNRQCSNSLIAAAVSDTLSRQKSVDEATVRLLLAAFEKESLTVYTDEFRA